MRIVTFASGSTGNCSLLSDGRANILIDAGISMRRIVSCLGELGLTPHDVCGVLITHEHSDHISGLPMLVKHYGVRVYAPSELAEVLVSMKPQLADYICCTELNKAFNMDGVDVAAFRTPHDSKFSVGYRFSGAGVFAFATDTGSVTDDMLSGLCGAETVVIEANHDIDMLKYGPYPYFLKKRILSSYGHLSNEDCKNLALTLAKSGTRHIILGHLSRENNTPDKAYAAVGGALCGMNVELSVAPADSMLEVYIGEV
ncbi:MAG: MBL fold metallo-hydrolase [Bacillota bacterium]|nr:MBL fold metallo-hydrolase [Bacillota bacterium]